MKKLLTGFLSLTFSLLVGAESKVYEGALEGAPYTVATPDEWKNGKVFFHVHGWRPADSPHEADLDTKDSFYASLLADGWMIGRTAFLENGVDHDAHTLALRDLRKWIEEEFGQIETLILEGESTAGTLVLRIAEKDADLADGVIALGPFIDLEDAEKDSFLSATPKLPSILMSNISEIVDSVAYAASAENAKFAPALRPLLRPGHVNVNWVERRAALDALESTLASGDSILFSNGTRNVPPRETETVKVEGGFENRVTSVNPYYGNAFLGFHPDDFTDLGIAKGNDFEVVAGDDAWTVRYGTSYGDVAQGEWVAFPTADEFIMLVQNHESAIETANLKIGDVVQIRALKESKLK